MKVIETDLPGCLVFEPRVFGDDRGYFFESFNNDKLATLEVGGGVKIRVLRDRIAGRYVQNAPAQPK